MKSYLKLYNLILAIGWSFLLIWYIIHGFKLDNFGLILINVCQGAAMLEILHSALKWVSSPIVTTFIQVFSRIFVLVLIDILGNTPYFSIAGINGLHLVMLAWTITEIVRYSFYFSGLLEKESRFLLFCRYTFFILLYPMGVAGELLIVYTWLNGFGLGLNLPGIAFGIIVLTYIIFFPKMYLYMWKQRKTKLPSP